MGILHLKDQWPMDVEMMIIDGVLIFGDGFVLIWDGIDGLWMEIG